MLKFELIEAKKVEAINVEFRHVLTYPTLFPKVHVPLRAFALVTIYLVGELAPKIFNLFNLF